MLRRPSKPLAKKASIAPVEMVVVTKEEAGARLDRWFKRRFDGVTQGEVEKLLRTGQIRVDGARAGASDRLEEGQSVRVPPLAERPPESKKEVVKPVSEADAAYIRSLVIYEDDELFALNKPAGLAVQGGTSTKRHVDGMSAALGDGTYRPRLVHRLDRDTSGVLILAKHPAAAARLGGLFRSRKLTKVYWAIVLGVPNPPMGEIRGWMIKAAGPGSDREMMRTARHGEPDARFSITDYEVVSQAAQRASWVALKPVTGRTHQLRLHMAQIGCAMLGDRKYTCDREEPGGDVGTGLHLHARGIELPRESGPPLQIKADLPPHMLQTFEALGFNPKELGRSAIAPFQTDK
jgi:23S rRNA pseudouridine955/2504/2580 synthase